MTGAAVARMSKVLDVPPLRPGQGRECSLLACLAIAAGSDYDDLMGASGAAFTTTIDAGGWDPLAASPLDAGTLERAARAAGVRSDVVTPPFDDEMRALVLDRVAETVRAKTPVAVRGIVGPPEYGLIVGVDERAPAFHARTYFDARDEPSTVGWDAFQGPGRGEVVFLDPARAPERATIVRDALAYGVAAAGASDDALRAWLAALRDEERWRDPKHGGTAAFADHAMRTILADKRRSAARYLRSVRDALSPRASAEALRAAEAYGKVVAAAEKVGAGAFDPSIAMRFAEGGQRRAWANALDAIVKHEAEAHEALAAVLA